MAAQVQRRTMEPTLYQDESVDGDRSSGKLTNMKRSMTLDFNGAVSQSKKQKMSTLLQSPDLNMLKLASPELEKLIIQANGMVTTTPTPTQILFPKFVTEEQEAYAQGFVAALEELRSNPVPGKGVEQRPTVTLPDMSKNVFSTTTSLPGGIFNIGSNGLPSKSLLQSASQSQGVRVKEEPQTVPCGLNSPPPSPINMADQEVFKLERKRARNRVAARKCRTRKLERIARLEDKVDDLKGVNDELSVQATKLREEVCKLKRTIIEHVNSGCHIMMSQNMTF